MALRGQASPYEPSPGADVTAGPSPVLAQYECAMAAAKRGKASRAMLTDEWRQWVTEYGGYFGTERLDKQWHRRRRWPWASLS